MICNAYRPAMVLSSFAQLMESQRDWVVSELEQMFKQYGNFLQKSSLEIESQLYDKARNAEEYMVLARRLLRHMLDVARQRQCKPKSPTKPEAPVGRLPFREDTGPNPFRVTAAPAPVAPFPVTILPQTSVSVNLATIATQEEPPATTVTQTLLSDTVYDAVRLPAPNKRTMAATLAPKRKPSLSRRGDAAEHMATVDEKTEIVTRMLPSDAHVADSELSQDTYEASYKFLVPRNSVIKQITIHLKKLC